MKKVILFLMLFSVNVFATPVDINQASAKEISKALKGIGIKKAEAIVQHRKDYGPFSSAAELTKVKGVGKKTVENNKGDIKVGKKKSSKKKTK